MEKEYSLQLETLNKRIKKLEYQKQEMRSELEQVKLLKEEPKEFSKKKSFNEQFKEVIQNSKNMIEQQKQQIN